MIFNAGYFSGITGPSAEYLYKAHRIIFRKMFVQTEIPKRLASLIESVKPDILFLSEIRNDKNIVPIKNLFAKHLIDVKYKPGSIYNFLPFFGGNCNGVFLRGSFPIHKFFVRNGSKKLVYRIDITDNFSIFFSHFSFLKRTRHKQLSEIAHLAKQKQHAVIAGDLNIFNGIKKLEKVLGKANLSVVNNLAYKTFPSRNPVFAIDMFLTSPSVKPAQIEVLNNVFLSDHLPVVAEFKL